MKSSTRNPLLHSLVKGLGLFLVLAAYMIASTSGGEHLYAPLPVESGGYEVPTENLAPGSPAALIAEHDCWTGDAPADMEGELPGHVVVSLPNGEVVYGGERMVGKAFDQIFDGVDHGLTVAAFCR